MKEPEPALVATLVESDNISVHEDAITSNRADLLLLIVIVGFVVAVYYEYVNGMYLALKYPFNTFLFRPSDALSDFTNILDYSKDLAPYELSKVKHIGGYPPFAYLIGGILGQHFDSFYVALTILPLSVAALAAMGFFELRATLKRPVYAALVSCVLTFCSYPVQFALDRGNIDVIVAALLALSLVCIKNKKYTIAVPILAVAGAAKIYPLAFMMLFFLDKKYAASIFTLAISIALNITAMAFMKGGFTHTLQTMQLSLQESSRMGLFDGTVLKFNSSLYAMLATLLPVNVFQHNPTAWKIYTTLSLLCITFVWLYISAGMIPFWKAVALVTCCTLLLPFTTGDYRLVILMPAIWFYVCYNKRITLDLVVASLFAFILIPKAYFNIGDDKNIGILVNPVLILSLMLLMFFSKDKCEKLVTCIPNP